MTYLFAIHYSLLLSIDDNDSFVALLTSTGRVEGCFVKNKDVPRLGLRFGQVLQYCHNVGFKRVFVWVT